MDDLRKGWRFYERKQAGLGDYFQESLFSDIDLLERNAGVHRRVFGFHRLLSRRFPYAIYYRVEGEDTIVVWRILDMRQDPDSIRDELG